MKKLLIPALLISGYINTNAQQANRRLYESEPVNPAPAKTTGEDSRLIGTTKYKRQLIGLVQVDSTALFYTDNNGWDYVTGDWKYDSSRTWTFDRFTYKWNEQARNVQQLANDRITSRLRKTPSGFSWVDDERTVYAYTNGLVTTKQIEDAMGGGVFLPLTRLVNTYNATGQEIENVQQNIGMSGQLENNTRIISHYNSAGQKDTTWTQAWVSITGQWQTVGRSMISYVNGLPAKVLEQEYTGTSWVDIYQTSNWYLNGRLIARENEEWDASTNSWLKVYRMERNHDKTGNVIEQRNSFLSGGKYVNHSRILYTYEWHNRVWTEKTEHWSVTDNGWIMDDDDYFIRNYYEAYTNDVQAIASNHGEIEVYPVPAKEQITISASFKQMQPVTISITDMSGKVVKRLADHAGMQYHKSIGIAELPAGTYILNVRGTTEMATKTISISH